MVLNGSGAATHTRTAAAQSPARRRGTRQLDAAAAGHAAWAAHVRRPVCRGRRGPGSRVGPRPPDARRVRTRPRAQSEARAQPADGRHALGMGQALLEGNQMDPRSGSGRQQPGRISGRGERGRARGHGRVRRRPDDVVGPLGVKGVGEIGQVGAAASIANAVFHATGRRIRELPMAAELVMDPVGVPA